MVWDAFSMGWNAFVGRFGMHFDGLGSILSRFRLTLIDFQELNRLGPVRADSD